MTAPNSSGRAPVSARTRVAACTQRLTGVVPGEAMRRCAMPVVRAMRSSFATAFAGTNAQMPSMPTPSSLRGDLSLPVMRKIIPFFHRFRVGKI